MIELTIHMNSDITDVLEWKCCNINGLNLELIFYNSGEKEVVAPNSFILENDNEKITIDTVYPPWLQKIQPKDYGCIYCSMEDKIWQKYHTLTIKDESGQEHQFPIVQ